MMSRAYCENRATLLAALSVDPKCGLNDDAVLRHRETYGINELSQAKKITLFQRLVGALCEPMTLLLLLAAAILLGVNLVHLFTGGETDFAECAGVAVAIFLSVGISVTMEGRSAKAFEALRAIGADVKPQVLRNGRRIRISQSELVVGDIVFISTGDKLTADGRLLETHGLIADESALTGESAPVEKSADADVAPESPVAERPTMLYAGSFITAGSGVMIVTAVGMQTEFGRIAGALSSEHQGETPLQERLAVLGRRVTTAGVLAAMLVFIARLWQAFSGDAFTWSAVGEAFISAIVLVVACVPEGLPTIVAMSLAVNVLRMAKQNALVKRMVASETIGCVTFICSDKTGTLTENRMTLVALVDANGETSSPTEMIWRNICLNSTADVDAEGKTFTGNPTEGAMLMAAVKAGFSPRVLREEAQIHSVEPFSSDTKRMITHLGGEKPLSLMKGSPEVILAICDLNDEALATAQDAMSVWQERACRVLAFAHRHANSEEWVYDGFAAITDPIRAEVPDAIAACRTAGIEVMMTLE